MESRDMPDGSVKEMPGGWHLDKKVSIGHIVTTAVVVIGVVIYAVRQEGRIDGTEQEISFNKERIEKLDRDYRQGMSEIKGLLERIDNKLDRKVDK